MGLLELAKMSNPPKEWRTRMLEINDRILILIKKFIRQD